MQSAIPGLKRLPGNKLLIIVKFISFTKRVRMVRMVCIIP
jgi:hypothetical protein